MSAALTENGSTTPQSWRAIADTKIERTKEKVPTRVLLEFGHFLLPNLFPKTEACMVGVDVSQTPSARHHRTKLDWRRHHNSRMHRRCPPPERR